MLVWSRLTRNPDSLIWPCSSSEASGVRGKPSAASQMCTSIYPCCLQCETEVVATKTRLVCTGVKLFLSTVHSQLRTSYIYQGLMFCNCVTYVKEDSRELTDLEASSCQK